MSYLKRAASNVEVSSAHTSQHPLYKRLGADRAAFLNSEARPGGDAPPTPPAYSVPRTYRNKMGVWTDPMIDQVLEKILFGDTSVSKTYLTDTSIGWSGPDSVLVVIGEEGPDGRWGHKEIQVATTTEKHVRVDAAIRKMVLWEMMREHLEVRGFCEFTVDDASALQRTQARSGPAIRTAFLFTEWLE